MNKTDRFNSKPDYNNDEGGQEAAREHIYGSRGRGTTTLTRLKALDAIETEGGDSLQPDLESKPEVEGPHRSRGPREEALGALNPMRSSQAARRSQGTRATERLKVSKAKRRSEAIESMCILQSKCTELVETYMPLVRQIARRYSQFNPDSLEDLVQVGAIGLLKAIRYYDPNRPRSASFKTLATCYIRGEIRHYLRDHCSLVQVPRRLAEVTSQISQLEEKLTQVLDHTPTVQELATYSGLSVKEILEAQLSWEARLHYESFDSTGEDEDRDERRSLCETVPDRKYQELQRSREDRELVSQALQRLGERSRRILEFVFFYDLSQKETASVLGLSEMGVSRALHSGLKKLKEIMSGDCRNRS